MVTHLMVSHYIKHHLMVSHYIKHHLMVRHYIKHHLMVRGDVHHELLLACEPTSVLEVTESARAQSYIFR